MPYKERYGTWAGKPRGDAPDFTRCCVGVTPPREHIIRQCSKSRGHGPNGEYCAAHNPDAVARRQALASYRWHLKLYDERMRPLKSVLPIIQSIADGHNAPRALCQEWLDQNAEKITPPTNPEDKL